MEFIELSYPYTGHMPVFPGVAQDQFIFTHQIRKGAHCNKGYFLHYTHNGSHVDAPFHFDGKGKTIDKIPIHCFVYEKPFIIAKKLSKSGFFPIETIQENIDEIRSADLILFYTGYSQFRDNNELFLDDFPTLSLEAARYIREEITNIKAIAIDVISIESIVNGPLTKNIVHKTLLDEALYPTRPLLIYEDINIHKVLNKKIKRIYAFPLRLVGMDASPVNMVAEVEEE